MAERLYKTAGMPRAKQINLDDFVALCELQATLKEISGFFSVDELTMHKWLKENLGMTYTEAFDQFRTGGLISLRRTQFQLAEKNPAMAIWLGKQHLGQKDIITYNNLDDSEDDPLTASIKNMSKQSEEE